MKTKYEVLIEKAEEVIDDIFCNTDVPPQETIDDLENLRDDIEDKIAEIKAMEKKVMSNIRHIVVARKDLQLSPGLLAAQVAHISDQFMRYQFPSCKEGDINHPSFSNNQLEWMNAPYLSVLAVNCAEDLEAVKDHAETEQLRVHQWFDLVPSPTFPDRSIKVLVGISIGPDDFDKIKIVTGALPLY